VATQNYVKRLYVDFLGRAAGPSEVDYWSSLLLNHTVSRLGITLAVSSSSEWITGVITKFYLNTLNRQPDPAGLAGWVSAAKGGMPIATIAAAFYASDEYFQTIGRSDYRTWVTDLYQKLLLRSPDPAGLDGWVAGLNSGISRNTVAFGFYQSPETLGVRITALYRTLLARGVEPGGVANWSPFVANQGDLVLAAALASSDEYFSRAQL
jgi:hypothetical protein